MKKKNNTGITAAVRRFGAMLLAFAIAMVMMPFGLADNVYADDELTGKLVSELTDGETYVITSAGSPAYAVSSATAGSSGSGYYYDAGSVTYNSESKTVTTGDADLMWKYSAADKSFYNEETKTYLNLPSNSYVDLKSTTAVSLSFTKLYESADAYEFIVYTPSGKGGYYLSKSNYGEKFNSSYAKYLNTSWVDQGKGVYLFEIEVPVVQYEVSFETNGADAITSQMINEGEKVTKPADPSRTGFTFGGWFKDSALETAWDFDKDTVAGKMTLYAKWTENEYAVTFESNEGSAVDPQTIKYNGKVTKPADPSRSGYTFDGWFRDAELQTAWDFDNDTVTAETTIYAKWTKQEEKQDADDDQKKDDKDSEAQKKAAAKKKAQAVGATAKVAAGTVKVTSTKGKTVTFKKAANKKTVSVPKTVKIAGDTFKVTAIEANAFKGSKATTAVIGANVKTIKAKAFKGSKVKTVIVKTRKLTKKSVKNSLKGSKVKTIKVKVGSKKQNKKFVKKYKKVFTKKNAGRKAAVK